jgi:glycosyltransferase involved in cell wall biosynthesis
VRDLVRSADGPVVVQCNGEEGAQLPNLRPDLNFGLVATPRYSEYPGALMQEGSLDWWTRLRLFLTEHKYLAQGEIARKADRSVPPSAYAARMLHEAYGVPEERLDVVHNGVPREFLEYDHDPSAIENGPLVFFGRFATHKGVDTLIDALSHLGDDAPPTRIIGRGVLEDELRAQIDRLDLTDRVSFHPWMTHHELGEALREARMAVLPSREENFSLAILSALAVGTPTISTEVGGTPEIIDDGETGLLVPPDDPPALADAIGRLQSNPDEARRIGANGQSHVRNNLTWAVAAEQFEALFEQILEERGLAQASR